ncbi:uncharacterized protein LOC9644842 [Selaginella moellendorffii]|uniref:uncharacterized protein LOC9644842 n=1 Tax=Selaginella moellendorffii TaxID=88036 RepID=UPI000D1CBAF5|nr:uncharacterized protein LOC9644842 [Selaginella moellendorffii]|eukprot:XP_024521446.1 uncharacterized protein LOC9644842 [Selaginella moellendorffii]
MAVSGMPSAKALVAASEPVRVIFSAGSYLADGILTVITLVQYYKFPDQLLRRNFYNLLVVLIGSQIVSVVVFKLKIPVEQQPIQSALFFPLIQLWNLARHPKASIDRREMSTKSTLFSIVMLTVKSSQALAIEYDAIYKKRLSSPGNSFISPVLILGVIATLVSGTLNGSIAVASKTTNANSWKKKAGVAILAGRRETSFFFSLFQAGFTVFFLAGLHIGSAILLNAISCSVFVITGVSYFPFVIVLLSTSGILLWLLFWLVLTRGPKINLKQSTGAVIAAFMSFCASPLYVLASDAHEHKELGTRRYRIKLLFMGIVKLAPEVASWILLFRRPRPQIANAMFFARLGLAQATYFASGIAILWLDYRCGPVPSGHAETAAMEINAAGVVPGEQDCDRPAIDLVPGEQDFDRPAIDLVPSKQDFGDPGQNFVDLVVAEAPKLEK